MDASSQVNHAAVHGREEPRESRSDWPWLIGRPPAFVMDPIGEHTPREYSKPDEASLVDPQRRRDTRREADLVLLM